MSDPLSAVVCVHPEDSHTFMRMFHYMGNSSKTKEMCTSTNTKQYSVCHLRPSEELLEHTGITEQGQPRMQRHVLELLKTFFTSDKKRLASGRYEATQRVLTDHRWETRLHHNTPPS